MLVLLVSAGAAQNGALANTLGAQDPQHGLLGASLGAQDHLNGTLLGSFLASFGQLWGSQGGRGTPLGRRGDRS